MKNGMFVFDAVIHALDYRDSQGIHPDHALLRAQIKGGAQAMARKGPPFEPKAIDAPAPTDWANEKLFGESDTDMAVAQTVPLFSLYRDGVGPARLNYELSQSNPDRILFCGGVDPMYQGIRGAVYEMERQAGEWGAVSFKFYQSQTPRIAWRADDREIAYPLWEAAQRLGIKLVQFHKGLPLAKGRVEDLRPNDIQLAAYDFPDLNFGLHHLGDPYIDETINIAARWENVYLILPLLFNQYFVQPTAMLHWLGKALFNVGPDRICYGTDAFVWPHVQAYIDAFAEMEMPDELQDGYGYPALTPEVKEKIFGRNLAVAMGIDLDAKKAALGQGAAAVSSATDR